jgi:hypothetical protein
MGIYVYGLKKKTRQHPVYGEVGVLHYIYKPFWSPTPEQERWEAQKEAYYEKNWANRSIPRYVVFEGDKEFKDVRYYRGGATWSDGDENRCIPMTSLATAKPEFLEKNGIVLADELKKLESVV